MLLVKLTTEDSKIFRIAYSESGVRALDGSTMVIWRPHLVDISPIQLRPDKVYGGMVRNSGTGSISISPDATVWPPPLKLIVDVRDCDEFGKVTNLFISTGYLKIIGETEIKYTLYDREIDVDLLDDDTSDYGSAEDRVLPLTLGTVSFKQAMRVGTSLDYTYYKADMQGNDPSISGGDYDVHEDGSGQQKDKYTVPDSGTVVDNGDGTFKSVLKSDGTTENEPYGNILISGTGSITTLTGLFTWAIARINTELGTSYTLNSTYVRSPSPPINYYVTEQQNIIDFLSSVSAYFTHYFYIDYTTYTFYLGDMFVDNGSTHLSSTDGKVTYFFSGEYEYPAPLKEIKGEWTITQIITDKDGYYVLEEITYMRRASCSNRFGIEEDIEPLYDNVAANIQADLIRIGTLIQAPESTVKVPFDIVATPGMKFYWTDTSVNHDSTVNIRARKIQYDPQNSQITIIGQVY